LPRLGDELNEDDDAELVEELSAEPGVEVGSGSGASTSAITWLKPLPEEVARKRRRAAHRFFIQPVHRNGTGKR